MKNVMKTMVAFLVIMLSVQLNASSYPNTEPTNKTKKEFVLQKKNEVVYLNLLNLDQNSVNITVRDAVGRLVFSETVSNSKVVHKSLNFEKAFKGTYTVKVIDGSNVYRKKVYII